MAAGEPVGRVKALEQFRVSTADARREVFAVEASKQDLHLPCTAAHSRDRRETVAGVGGQLIDHFDELPWLVPFDLRGSLLDQGFVPGQKLVMPLSQEEV